MSTCIDCGNHFDSRNKSYSVRCFPCYKKWKCYCDAYDPNKFYPVVESILIDKYRIVDRRKSLLQLCHPDKHGNSKISNDVTQWLNSLPRN